MARCFYPLNHLVSGTRTFHSDFTFIRGEKRTQVGFLFTNNNTNIKHFDLGNSGLEVYPLNHLVSGTRTFDSDFTFIRGEKRSQVGFLFTNNHTYIKHFDLDNSGLEVCTR